MSVAYLDIWSKKAKIKQGKAGSGSYMGIIYRYQFSCVFSLLYLACMALHVVLCFLGMGFSRCESLFSLAFPFLDSHGVVEFSCFGLVGLSGGFKAE